MGRPILPILAGLTILFLSSCGGASSSHREARDEGKAIEPSRPLRLFVVRHAEAYKNLSPPPKVPKETLDSLTEKGQAQSKSLGRAIAQRLGEDLSSWPEITIFYSPTGRTRETAESLAAVLHARPQESKNLAPLREGQKPDGARSDWSWRVSSWSGGEDPRPEGGESLADGVKRALLDVHANPAAACVILVSHGDIVAGILGEAAGTPLSQRWSQHEVPTGSVTEMQRREDGSWRIEEPWTSSP